jgi:hypothetical protein
MTDPFVVYKSRAALARERFANIHAARMTQIATPPLIVTPPGSPGTRACDSPQLDFMKSGSPKLEPMKCGTPQPEVELSMEPMRVTGAAQSEEGSPSPLSSPSVRHKHLRSNSRGDIDRMTITVGQASGIEPMPPKILSRPSTPLAKGGADKAAVVEPTPEEKQHAEDVQFDKNLDELLGWLYAMKDDYPKWGCKEIIDLLAHSKDEFDLIKFHREQMASHSAKVTKDIFARLKKH